MKIKIFTPEENVDHGAEKNYTVALIRRDGCFTHLCILRTFDECIRAKNLFEDCRAGAVRTHDINDQNDNIIISHIIKQLSVEFDRPLEQFFNSEAMTNGFFAQFQIWITQRPMFEDSL